jgi:hypothetical protein
MASELPALGICLEEYAYPYPVHFFPLSSDLQPLNMAYMDIPPDREPNGKTVVLTHGRGSRLVPRRVPAVPRQLTD